MQPIRAWKGEGGYIAPIFLAVVSVVLILSWVVVEVASAHFLSAARQTRDIQAGQLARAGVEAALAEIDETDAPRERITGEEETGTYEVTITPTGRGTYTVVSTGTADSQSKTITAEVAPSPDPFAVLARGDVRISSGGILNVGGIVTIDGAVDAGGDVVLTSAMDNGDEDVNWFEKLGGVLVTGGTLHVKGDVTAGENATLRAAGGALGWSKVKVDGSVRAGSNVTYEATGLIGGGKIEVGGTTYGGKLRVNKSNLSSVDSGSVREVEGVTVPSVREADTSYYESLVADLEAKGQMTRLKPKEACGSTITENTRITGDLKCTGLLKDSITIEEGAVVVVDGSVDVDEADVRGLLYVRGGSTPNDLGNVKIGTLSLLELVGYIKPVVGGGTVAATGDIEVSHAKLAELLTFWSINKGAGSVLQILALSTGPDDTHNDIDFGFNGLIKAASSAKSTAPLLIYAGGDGDVNISVVDLANALNLDTLPMIAVAGGDVNIDCSGLLKLVGMFTIKAEPDMWEYAPPFLRGMGRSYVMSWEWTDS